MYGSVLIMYIPSGFFKIFLGKKCGCLFFSHIIRYVQHSQCNNVNNLTIYIYNSLVLIIKKKKKETLAYKPRCYPHETT